ncbi:VOC family protein [Candidatus Saccharibacteria bacterium]|nr:VOC family protein [Candidatus Saccharibacteria bacterium]
MLSDATVFATIAVSDLTESKEFYGGMLGLIQTDQNPAGISYESGGGQLFIYQSPTAGTNEATCAAWKVDDVEATVEGLKAQGVAFEHYEIPGGEYDGDVAIMGPMHAAWFKDPDGNILSVGN